MKVLVVVLVLWVSVVFAVQYEPIKGSSSCSEGVELRYDDGTPCWVFVGLAYYGVYFDPEDFGVPSLVCDESEWWFYHSSHDPWDTDQVRLEIWNGEAAMPMTQLREDVVTALHYYPVIIDYYPSIETDQFWLVANTDIYSATGSPTPICDGSGNFTGTAHSFGSDDWILWDPFIPETEAVDIIFRGGEMYVSLASSSWGAIKGLYR